MIEPDFTLILDTCVRREEGSLATFLLLTLPHPTSECDPTLECVRAYARLLRFHLLRSSSCCCSSCWCLWYVLLLLVFRLLSHAVQLVVCNHRTTLGRNRRCLLIYALQQPATAVIPPVTAVIKSAIVTGVKDAVLAQCCVSAIHAQAIVTS